MGQEFCHLVFRQCAGKAVGQLPVLDQNDRGHGLDLECRRQFLLLRYIDLGQQESAVVVGSEFFQQRTQCLARLEPGSPEIDQDRCFQLGADHRVLEGRDGGVEHAGIGGISHGLGHLWDALEMAMEGTITSRCKKYLTSKYCNVN